MSVAVKENATTSKGKPKWLRVKLPTGKKYTQLRGLVE
ncbi:MAG: lipoic acid synthetase, partial [Maribacter sp.]